MTKLQISFIVTQYEVETLEKELEKYNVEHQILLDDIGYRRVIVDTFNPEILYAIGYNVGYQRAVVQNNELRTQFINQLLEDPF